MKNFRRGKYHMNLNKYGKNDMNVGLRKICNIFLLAKWKIFLMSFALENTIGIHLEIFIVSMEYLEFSSGFPF